MEEQKEMRTEIHQSIYVFLFVTYFGDESHFSSAFYNFVGLARAPRLDVAHSGDFFGSRVGQ